MTNKVSMPIWRWTVGPVNRQGFQILKESARQIRRLYGERFRLIICHNNLCADQLRLIRTFGTELFSARPFSLPRPAEAEKWKLYPPRLDDTVHEIVMDNDIIIFKKLDIIERFLKDDFCLVYEGLHGLHGKYKDLVPGNLKVNSGFYGMPPGFLFKKHILDVFRKDEKNIWEDRFDDQGLVGGVLTRQKYEILRQKELPICEPEMDLPEECSGIHFVYANRAESASWIKYQMLKKWY